MTKRILTFLMIVLPTLLLFQNCSSSHSPDGESTAASTGGSIIQTTCVAANQDVVSANQQAALALVQTSWPTPAAGSDEANAVSNIVTCVQSNGTQGCTNQITLGSPQTSNLYIKAVDGVWPEGGTALSPNQLATLRDWILNTQVNCDALAIGPGNPQSGSGGGGGSNAATFTQVNNTIIQQYCIGCHGNGGESPNLSNYGDVAGSAAACLSAIQPGGNMPLGEPPLSQSLQTLFANWVNGGAQND